MPMEDPRIEDWRERVDAFSMSVDAEEGTHHVTECEESNRRQRLSSSLNNRRRERSRFQ